MKIKASSSVGAALSHVFVVMLENRSFDHMLGFSNLRGTDAETGQPTAIEGLTAGNGGEGSNTDAKGAVFHAHTPADWAMAFDPPHDFASVQEQLCGVGGTYAAPKQRNGGFVSRYSHLDPSNPDAIMRCYAPEQVPVMTTLAREFAVCDRWHSSLPGPTWPNRFFVHAASSAGLDDSPSGLTSVSSLVFNGYRFANGTIYDRLDQAGLPWRVYHGDAFPQVLAISGMSLNIPRGRFKDFADFPADVQSADYAPVYTFIEPNYGHTITHGGDFTCGNSQHPKDDVTRGDALLKTIYETIRNSPLWESSALIITYDEHGGFYDHVFPPSAVPPGDAITNTGNNHHNFDFALLGVRVPAIIVSPFVPRGTIDHTLYDHTSILATLEQLFNLSPLTNRDRDANTLSHLFSLENPRTAATDAPSSLPAPATSGITCEEIAAEINHDAANLSAPLDSTLEGFLHVAFLRDQQVTPPQEQPQRTAQYQQITTKGQALAYMDQVRQRLAGSA